MAAGEFAYGRGAMAERGITLNVGNGGGHATATTAAVDHSIVPTLPRAYQLGWIRLADPQLPLAPLQAILALLRATWAPLQTRWRLLQTIQGTTLMGER